MREGFLISIMTTKPGDVPGLKAFCHREPQCVAFNTNGWLKRSLPPRDSWKRWTDIPQHGLYLKAPP